MHVCMDVGDSIHWPLPVVSVLVVVGVSLVSSGVDSVPGFCVGWDGLKPDRHWIADSRFS